MDKIKLNIDGRDITADTGSTILEVAESVGIDIPNLCRLEGLPPNAACRICVVEVEGARALVASCSAPVGPNMVVHTATERVPTARRLVMELLMDLRALIDEVADGEVRGNGQGQAHQFQFHDHEGNHTRGDHGQAGGGEPAGEHPDGAADFAVGIPARHHAIGQAGGHHRGEGHVGRGNRQPLPGGKSDDAGADRHDHRGSQRIEVHALEVCVANRFGGQRLLVAVPTARSAPASPIASPSRMWSGGHRTS